MKTVQQKGPEFNDNIILALDQDTYWFQRTKTTTVNLWTIFY